MLPAENNQFVVKLPCWPAVAQHPKINLWQLLHKCPWHTSWHTGWWFFFFMLVAGQQWLGKNQPWWQKTMGLCMAGKKTAARAKFSVTTWRNNVDRSPQERLVVATASTHRLIVIYFSLTAGQQLPKNSNATKKNSKGVKNQPGPSISKKKQTSLFSVITLSLN